MPGYNHKGGYERAKDLTGMKFGRLTVLEKSEPFRGRDGKVQCAGWMCRCDCGKEVRIRANSLLMGHTKSCGCLNREKPSNHITHHMSNTKIYMVWKGIKARCLNPDNERYKYYGGRGITVCKEWLEDFMNFYNWAMANGYSENLTIERKDVNGNYCPENCYWISFERQAFNKTNTVKNEKGESIAEMARNIGIVSPQIARWRYKHGRKLHEALYTPKNESRKSL